MATFTTTNGFESDTRNLWPTSQFDIATVVQADATVYWVILQDGTQRRYTGSFPAGYNNAFGYNFPNIGNTYSSIEVLNSVGVVTAMLTGITNGFAWDILNAPFDTVFNDADLLVHNGDAPTQKLFGGSNSDSFIMSAQYSLGVGSIINGGNGNDTIRLQGGVYNSLLGDGTIESIERIDMHNGSGAEPATSLDISLADLSGWANTLIFASNGNSSMVDSISVDVNAPTLEINLSNWNFESNFGLEDVVVIDANSSVGTIVGSQASDIIYANNTSTIIANGGNDIISISNGPLPTFINGGDGNDRLNLGGGTHTLTAGQLFSIEKLALFGPSIVNFTGADGFANSLYGIQEVIGNLETQTIHYVMDQTTFLDLSAMTFSNWEQSDRIEVIGDASIESVVGSGQNEIFEGQSGDSFSGFGGDDVFRLIGAGVSNITFNGGLGNNTLELLRTSTSSQIFDLTGATLTGIQNVTVNVQSANSFTTDVKLDGDTVENLGAINIDIPTGGGNAVLEFLNNNASVLNFRDVQISNFASVYITAVNQTIFTPNTQGSLNGNYIFANSPTSTIVGSHTAVDTVVISPLNYSGGTWDGGIGASDTLRILQPGVARLADEDPSTAAMLLYGFERIALAPGSTLYIDGGSYFSFINGNAMNTQVSKIFGAATPAELVFYATDDVDLRQLTFSNWNPSTDILRVIKAPGLIQPPYVDIYAATVATEVLGGNGSDTIYGNIGNDRLFGGENRDQIIGSAGADVMDGGTSFAPTGAEINYGDGLDYKLSTAGVTVNLSTNAASGGFAEGDTISNFESLGGSEFADTLTGTSIGNYLDGYGQNDKLYGLGGDDYMLGSGGTDQLYGGADKDTMSGGDDNDSMYGEDGDDYLEGGAGMDYLDGGFGLDTAGYSQSAVGVRVDMLFRSGNTGDAVGDTFVSIEGLLGSHFDDILYTTENDDQIDGGDGKDLMWARGGNDYLDGGAGDDSMYGRENNDTLIGGAGQDYMDGGDGYDIVSYENSFAGIIVDMFYRSGNTGDAVGDSFVGFEEIRGSQYADRLTATEGNDVINGYIGDDYLVGRGGQDTIYGEIGDDQIYAGAGNDTLIGGYGADYMDGGVDNDTASYVNAEEISGNGVNVDLQNIIANTGEAFGDYLYQIENITGSAFKDRLLGDGAANVLTGGAGEDLLFARAGTDTLYGDAGSDILEGGLGADYMDGGADNDTASYASAVAAVQVDLLLGNTAAPGSANANTGEAVGDLLYNIENLTGSVYGDRLLGTAGDNILNGGDGADMLWARAGNDTLNGGLGIDTIYGLEGLDILNGGGGNDIMDGGADFDTFRYDSASFGQDTINLFQDGLDKFSLAGSGLTFASFVITQSGANTLMTLNAGNTITLTNFTAGNITGADFI